MIQSVQTHNYKLENDAVKYDHNQCSGCQKTFTNLKDEDVERSVYIAKEPPQNHDKGDDQKKS